MCRVTFSTEKVSVDQLEEDTQRKYKFLRFLGQGAYGAVFAAREISTNVEVAIKRFDRIFDSADEARKILREIKILISLHHENFANLIELTAPAKYSSFNRIYLIYELVDADLEMILSSGQTLLQSHRRMIVYQLLRGLKYLHSAHVLHRDLKPSNVFINRNCEVKIGDFGFARVVGHPESPEIADEPVATRWYRAPDVFLRFIPYSSGIDVWSVGCILAELMGLRPMFRGESSANQLEKFVEVLGSPSLSDLQLCTNEAARKFINSIPRKDPTPFAALFPNSPTDEVDLLSKMLCWDPRKRITVDEALNHPFVSKLHDPFNEPVTSPMQDFPFENSNETVDDLRTLLWKEVLNFHPEFA